MAGRGIVAVAVALLAAIPAAGGPADFSRPEPGEEAAGGAATGRHPLNSSAFSHPSGNLSFERQLDFKVGDGIFRKLWVSAPSSTRSSDGLGPLWNARSCQSCHLKDGRGRVPAPGEAAVSLFLRLSIPPETEAQRRRLAALEASVIPEPTYGGQLQTFSVQGHLAEGAMELSYVEEPVRLADGTTVSLRRPGYRVASLHYGPMHPATMLSPRLAPPMIGLGLLELIPEAEILAAADPEDRDGDGISGRANRVWSREFLRPMLGRFGWKAGQPTVAQQAAEAFAGDMGLSTPLVRDPWGDCTPAQAECRAAPHGAHGEGAVEVVPRMFDLVAFYSRHLAVPARRDVADRSVLEGKRQFHAAGCAACHRPSHVTGSHPDRPELSGQRIWPYTDLLLHDMGEGLADGRPEGLADGREWRTPPLWGLGLTETVNGNAFYLHDGRARTVLEAILWHGGEAEAARVRVAAMTRPEREALLAFLRSL
ncbi:di-heme oxidoredictase family protein [Stella sp.]|uniref:di-heme oxidoreductase family protein n=1 Tax=Stella sp. TaxID=2912054 RepID=UPI0035AFB908